MRSAGEWPAAAREEHPQAGVDLGDRAGGGAAADAERFWSITMQDEMFRIASTAGRSWGSRRRAYVLNVSTSWRYASVHIVSNTSDDLSLPLRPVKVRSLSSARQRRYLEVVRAGASDFDGAHLPPS